MTDTPEFVAPPNLREMFIKTGRTMPRRYSPAHVAPWCEKLVEVMNRNLPVTATLTGDGPYKLTINIEVDIPALPSAEPQEPAAGG